MRQGAAPSARVIHFSGPTDIANARPLTAFVIPWGAEPWIGRFNRYTNDADGVSGFFTSPDPQSLCAVSGGQGYLVDVYTPSEWEPVEAWPITAVADITPLKLIVFADFTNLTAYGPDGFVWRTRRIASDGLKLLRWSEDGITGLAWSAPDDADIAFTVDPLTGEHTGGASLPDDR